MRKVWGLVLILFALDATAQIQIIRPSPSLDGANTWTGASNDFKGAISVGQTSNQSDGVYIYSSFATNGFFTGTVNQNLFIRASADGAFFQPVRGAFVYFDPTYGVVRDPSIEYSNNQFCVVYTNLSTTTFGLACSPDLLTWTHEMDVAVNVTGSQNVYAPEWFQDSDGSLHVFVAVETGGVFAIYETHPTNGYPITASTTWSTLVNLGLTAPNGTTGGLVDPFMVRGGPCPQIYCLWFTGSSPSYVGYYSSNSLTSGYSLVHGGTDWASWGSAEGPSLVQINATDWRVYLDSGGNNEYYSDSSDNWATWTSKTVLTSYPPGQHGTVKRLFDVSAIDKLLAAALAPPKQIALYGDGSTPSKIFMDGRATGTDAYIGSWGQSTLDYIRFIGGTNNMDFQGKNLFGTFTGTGRVAVDSANQIGVTLTTTASLPTCNSTNEGIAAAVSDSDVNTWGSTVVHTTGSFHVLAYCDGTNWTVAAK